MADVNELIKEKLQGYRAEVRDVAIEAVEYAAKLPPQALSEHIENMLRRIIRTREEDNR